MVRVLWGFGKNERVHHALKELDINGDGLIAMSKLQDQIYNFFLIIYFILVCYCGTELYFEVEFVEKSAQFPILCLPVFEMQDKLKGCMLGNAKWELLTEERSRKYGRRTVFEIMDRIGYEGEYLSSSVDILLR